MAFYNHNDEDGLLLTTSTQCSTTDLAQDDNSIIGIQINLFRSKNFIINEIGNEINSIRNWDSMIEVNNYKININ